MAKRCAACGHLNDGSLPLCSQCGTPLDANMRLILDLEKDKAQKAAADAARRQQAKDEAEYIPPTKHKKKKSPLPWVILGIAVVAAIVIFVAL